MRRIAPLRPQRRSRRVKCSVTAPMTQPRPVQPIRPDPTRPGGPPHLHRRLHARIMMGGDEAELIRLWRGNRGEVELEGLADNLAVQLGAVTEDLIRRWYQRNTGLPSRMRKSAFSIPSTNGWRPVWMGWLILVVRWSKPNSCCPGTSGAVPKCSLYSRCLIRARHLTQ